MRGNDLTPEDARRHEAFFWQRVAKGEHCWQWTGKRKSSGRYGEILNLGVYLAAHRVSWVLHHGRTLPGHLTIDHRCRNTLCVRPDHLDALVIEENVARTRGIYARTPKAYEKRDGTTTWRVRFRAYDATGTSRETSKTFPSAQEAGRWIEENSYSPLS